jgi:hypothetical protein
MRSFVSAIVLTAVTLTCGGALYAKEPPTPKPAQTPGKPADWKLTYEDNFDRKVLGKDWLILRGDWHINKDGQLQIQRQWTSHSFIMSNIPLRGRNVRVEFDAMIPRDQEGTFAAHIQAGALGWGAGGIDDRVGIEVVGWPAEKMTEPKEGQPASHNVLLDQWHRFVMALEDGQYQVQVDGKTLNSGTVAQGRSLLNSGLQFAACPGARVDNLKIFTAPMAKPLPEISDARPEENKRATVFAEKFYDPKKPGCGFQEAIDSLPPGGGVVILPGGTFTLRRFLDIHSHTTLMGQGPETVLRVMDVTAAPIASVSSKDGVHKLTLKGPHDFRKGDAFSYDNSWGHPINSKAPGQKGPRHMLGGGEVSENRLLILEVEGNTVTVNAPPPPGKGKTIVHFFPAVCSYQSEFAEVKDVQIVGPEKNPAGVGGGFMTKPGTFGCTSHPRFTRLVIKGWPGDGISAQGCDDGRLFDNTISGAAQGMHPGTTTLRTLVARNYSVDNGSGLFFCWYNSNGVYFRNFLKNFTGYPDAGDVFNTIACNKLTAGMNITVGYNGCLFSNEMPSLTVFSAAGKDKAYTDTVLGPGGRTYGLPPRYFTIAMNRINETTLFKYAQGNVIAANTAPDGTPTKLNYHIVQERLADEKPDKNLLANEVKMAPIEGLPAPITRTAPEPPPVLPGPVLDGRDYYDPNAPDCGFQKALDKLAKTGGTLRLPAGRYPLAQPLRVPSNVTLAGCGTGTLLLPKGHTPSLLTLRNAANVTIRELAIEGTWTSEQPPRGAAVLAQACENLSLVALDVRGWPGDAVAILGGTNAGVRDCRTLWCGGRGYAFRDVAGLNCETNSAVHCLDGFVLEAGSRARVTGCIAALNSTDGFRVNSPGALIAASNANNNMAHGILLAGNDVIAVGNTCEGNNQGVGPYAGIGVKATGARVLFNNCGDEQLYATQLVGIREEPDASRNEIRCNVTATLCTRRGHENEPSLIAEGKGSTVADNWRETILPSNDSVESLEWLKAQPKK